MMIDECLKNTIAGNSGCDGDKNLRFGEEVGVAMST
jgi:hypothetical protein